MADYDVVIIGAGPAGIFTALELADTGQKVLILEKGHDITTRASQNADRSTPLEERRRNIVCGWGGAGAFSDGKLTLTTEYGGNLDDFMSKAALQKEIDHVDAVYSQYGGADRKVYGDEHAEAIAQLKRRAAAADLALIPARIRHLGTDVNVEILKNMREALAGKVDIRCDTEVTELVFEGGRVQGAKVGDEY
ncbi:MAG: FAD-dependent oxidoreductase, partial [Negativicoccus succinicivorans]|nr:FAD-dependent oxidoreductase [Negativicoccus succinicivorans]